MNADLGVDRARFAAHVRRLLDDGCHRVSIFGTTGEGSSLSVAERIAAWEALVADGVPADALLPGTGACALTDAVELSRGALDLGAPAVLVLPPFYFSAVTDDGLLAFFDALVERVADDRLRILLYHIPQNTQVGFGVDLVARLLDRFGATIAGIKDSAGDADHTLRLSREFPELAVFAGSERALLEVLRAGGAGCISATANVTAPQARAVFDAHADGRDDDAAAAQEPLTAMRLAIQAHPLIPTIKRLLAEESGDPGWEVVRPPLEHGGEVGALRTELSALARQAPVTSSP